MIQVQTQYKEPKALSRPWKIEHTVELPPERFRDFKEHLLDDQPFIAEHSDELYTDGRGITHGMLVLCEGSDDGILVNSEGSRYARYSAFVSGARTLTLMDQYPALRDFCVGMDMLVTFSVERGLREQEDGQFCIDCSEVEEEAGLWIYQQTLPCFDRELFTKMLSARPEFAEVDVKENEIHVTLAPDFAQEPGPVQSM